MKQIRYQESLIKKRDWSHFTFIDLFAGIGGIRIGFEMNGGACVFSSENNESAQKTYEANFGERPYGDITTIASSEIPDHDILLAGFPCQPFSIMGQKKGFEDTRGTLFYEIERILEHKKPQAFLLENVKQFRSHDKGRTFKTVIKHLEDLGYYTYHSVLNSLDFGVPQKRERTFIVGFLDNIKFSFPDPYPVKAKLEHILEPDHSVDKKLFASVDIVKKRKEKLKKTPPNPSIWHENKAGNISPLPYSCALRAGASYNYLLVNGERRLSPRELLKLQGFPDHFKIVVSYSEIRKQTGNSVSVPVIDAIAKKMIEALSSHKKNQFKKVKVKTRYLLEALSNELLSSRESFR
jgi:DNA (cytosine-5)-methyltransferase 1